MTAQLTDQNFNQEVEAFPGAILIDLYTPTCGPCRTMDPWVDQLAQHYSGYIKVLKADVSSNPSVGSRFSVTAVPTFIVMENNRVLGRHVGSFPNSQALDGWVRRHFPK